jgi:hypothetical protein
VGEGDGKDIDLGLMYDFGLRRWWAVEGGMYNMRW